MNSALEIKAELIEGATGETNMTDWTDARHENAQDADEQIDEAHKCSDCGAEIDDGVCLFDTRDGQFVPGCMGKFDYFCDRACLLSFLLAVQCPNVHKVLLKESNPRLG